MANLFGQGGSNKQPPAAALRIQSSAQGQAIPLLLGGQTRLAPNLLWYGGFNYVNAPTQGAKGGVTGGGGKGQSGGYVYFASFVMGLCEGPVAALVAVWTNGSADSLPDQGLTAFLGSYSQTSWGFLAAEDPAAAIPFRGIVYAAAENYNLGSSPSLPNLNIEVRSLNAFALPGQPDGDLAVAFADALTSPYYGTGFPSARLGTLSGNPSTWGAYCLSLGLVGSPVVPSATTFAAWAKDLLTATASEAVWDQGKLTVVPYGDQAVVAGTQQQITETHIVPDASNAAQISVGNRGTFVRDLGVKNHNSGGSFVRIDGGDENSLATGQYSFAGVGLYQFSLLDTGVTVDITYEYTTVASFTPDVEPIYDFTLDDFMPNQGTIGSGLSTGDVPLIRVPKKPRSQRFTSIKVSYLDRSNNYNPVSIEIKDEASIIAFGRPRPSDVRALNFFNLGSAAQQSVALQLVREQVPFTYQWTVGRHFLMLGRLVMKVATVSDPAQGIVRQPVWIQEVTQNGDGSLTLTGDHFPGTASAPQFGIQAPSGYAANFNVDPGPVNAPIIFEPTDELAATMQPGGGLLIAGAVSGSNAALWGGANVWASYDDQKYEQVGTIFGPARMGVLTAQLPAVTTNPTGQTIDQANTLSVDLTESHGALASGTQQDATSLNTRCIIGGAEVVSFQTATLTAQYKYGLTYLVRGGYGTEDEIATWPIGTTFARLDQGVFSFPYDQSRIGSTIYLKFQSFNVWQGGLEDLSEIGAVTYKITGSALYSPLPNVANLRTAYLDGRTKVDWDEVSDFRNVMYEIRLGASWASALTLGTQAHPPFAVPGDGTYWVAAVSQPAAGRTIYSETPVSIAVQGSLISGNVLVAWDEAATGWIGTFSGGAGKDATINAIRSGGSGNILTDPNVLTTPNILDYGGDGSGYYEIPAAHWIDAGYNTQLALGVAYQGQGVPVGQNILSIADILGTPDILGSASTQYVDVHIEVAIGQDSTLDVFVPSDVFAEPDIFRADIVWSAWQKFTPGVYPGRFAKFRVFLGTVDPATIAYCVKLIFQALIPARVDQYNNLTVPSGGLAITFQPSGTTTQRTFNGGPKVSGSTSNAIAPAWNGSITGATPGDDIIVSNLTLTGCTVFVQNGGGNVTRSGVNLQFIGY